MYKVQTERLPLTWAAKYAYRVSQKANIMSNTTEDKHSETSG